MKYLFNYIYSKKVGATIIGLLLFLCSSAYIQNQPGDTIVAYGSLNLMVTPNEC